MTKQLPIRHYESAGGVIFDPAADRVLVLLRPGRPGPDGRDEVRLPKGHIEEGENRQGAALREVAEEAGLPELEIAADLGHQSVEFDWQGRHYVRDESYFLMIPRPGSEPDRPEDQFERLWLSWPEALVQLTFQAEREWVRRAWLAWDVR